MPILQPSLKFLPAFLLILATVASGCASLGGAGQGSDKEEIPPLVGVIERSEVEVHNDKWADALGDHRADIEVAAGLGESGTDTELTVYLGTWCSDSRREVTRFWQALDAVGNEVPFSIEYIGVDRDKAEPTELLEGVDLLYVPTFVVRRDGEEVGRIVEESPNGVETDLLALLNGTEQGLITAKVELLDGQAE